MRRWATISPLTACGAIAWIASMTLAQGFTPGNVVVVRVGDGTAPLTSAATPVFLEEFQPWAGTNPVQTMALPTAPFGLNRQFTLSGTAVTAAHLKRSVDGNFITLGGFDAAVGTASVNATASAIVNRVIACIAANGGIDTSTALTDAYGGSLTEVGQIRSVISINGQQFWTAGHGVSMAVQGVRYVSNLGATTSLQLGPTITNTRAINILNNQLYV